MTSLNGDKTLVRKGQTLAEWLREWRGGRSKYAAARCIGISWSSYVRWEQGDNCPRPFMAEPLAARLGLTIEQMDQLTGRKVA